MEKGGAGLRRRKVRIGEATALAVVLVAFWFLLDGCFSLAFGTLSRPGPAFFPVAASVLLILFGLTCFGVDKRASSNQKAEFIEESPSNGKGLALLVLELTTYVILLRVAGYYLPTFFFVATVAYLMDKKSFVVPIILATGTVLFSYFIFDMWLKVPLPRL